MQKQADDDDDSDVEEHDEKDEMHIVGSQLVNAAMNLLISHQSSLCTAKSLGFMSMIHQSWHANMYLSFLPFDRSPPSTCLSHQFMKHV
jgi:hypothetical protein